MNNVFQKLNKTSLKKYLVLSSITSFSIYMLIILLGLTLLDYAVFYSYNLCGYSLAIYICGGIIALLLYYVYFRKKIKTTIQQANFDVFTKIAENTSNLLNKHRIMEMFTQNLMVMVENTEGVGMWIKDEEDKYIFANKQLRNMLFKNKEMFEVVGRSDGDLLGFPYDYKLFEQHIINLPPKEYPNIESSELFEKGSICNTTDVITRVLKVPCRFYEEIGERSFDVYKTPLVDDNGAIIGTVGTLFEITEDKSKKRAELVLLAKQGRAYRINSSNNYYIKQYGFGDFL